MKYIVALLVLALGVGAPAIAQDAANLPLVGVLRINTPDTVEPMATQFRAALAALGQVDGRNIRLQYRLAEAMSTGSRGLRKRWSPKIRASSWPSATRRS